eukprot:XP_015579280.1 uncharacterized protein LOC107261837 [Ricinus communis]
MHLRRFLKLVPSLLLVKFLKIKERKRKILHLLLQSKDASKCELFRCSSLPANIKAKVLSAEFSRESPPSNQLSWNSFSSMKNKNRLSYTQKRKAREKLTMEEQNYSYGIPCLLRTSWTPMNPRRRFVNYSRRNNSCRFFQWIDLPM